MKRDVQDIPPAPRTVRWSTALAFRWPLAALAALLGAYGGVWVWMLFLAHGGAASDDWRMDEEPTVTLPRDGEPSPQVIEVRPDRGTIQGGAAEVVEYEFRFGRPGNVEPTTWKGASFVPAGRYRIGDAVRVQLLPMEPNRSRILGERANLTPDGVRPWFWFQVLVLPGAALAAIWLFGVLRFRAVLQHGDVSVAHLVGVRRVPFCLPEMWAVEFRFKDRHAHERTARHWVRAHSRLGQRLRRIERGSGESMPVLHDRARPDRCRLVLADDFPTAAPQAGPREGLRA